jgi:hypothetical protein
MRRLFHIAPFAAALVVTLAASSGCSSADDPVGACEEGTSIAAFKELMIVDEGVLSDARSRNATAGAWSFRHHMENMAPVGVDAREFVKTWLRSWADVTTVNGYPTDRPNEGRATTLHDRILCPWLKRSPENACNADCSSCATQTLDLAQAPFRLIAIVNRMDQRDEVAAEPNGEGRFAYALTDGAADDPASRALPMTVIFEYMLPETRSVKDWAEAWHGLAQFSTYDEPFRAALQQVTDGFTNRGMRPAGRNGSSIGQVRTNESALDWIWQQREFGLAEDGWLRMRPVRNTPAEALNNSTQLATWVTQNADAIKSKRFELPMSMRAASSDETLFVWQVPGVDEATRKAFASQTCNGCHSFENPSIDTVFHVSPFRQGIAKLSPFVYNPGGDGTDEISLRTTGLRRAICTGK